MKRLVVALLLAVGVCLVIVTSMHEIKDVLTAEQIRELPPFNQLYFDEKALKTFRPRMAFFPFF